MQHAQGQGYKHSPHVEHWGFIYHSKGTISEAASRRKSLGCVLVRGVFAD